VPVVEVTYARARRLECAGGALTSAREPYVQLTGVAEGRRRTTASSYFELALHGYWPRHEQLIDARDKPRIDRL
jgi:hypothetical protein